MSRRPRFRPRSFAIAALAVLFAHAVAIPRMFLPLLERPERPVEIAFIDDEPLLPKPLDDRPPADEEKRPEPPSRSLPPEKEKVEKDKPDKKEKDKEKPPEPKPVVVENKPPPPPPPPMEKQVHQKMVDQDKFPDEADNPDAKYLAQKNHRAAKDTRALQTNLVRDQRDPTPAPTEKSNNEAPQPGMKEQKVAELAKRAGKENQVVRSRPRVGDEGQAEKSAPGKLSMRGLTPKSVEQKAPADKARDGVELRDNTPGPMAEARQGAAGERAGSRSKGVRRPNLQLNPMDYDKIVGESVAMAERQRAAKSEISHGEGRWDKLLKKQQALRSSLENFTPDAYVGRESELGTRAHPYAAYIAEMHRGIHKLWAFSFLPSLDSRGALDPWNDMSRWTMISIVLSDSGAVESANISHPSGFLPFDTAAWDVVQQAGPFPRPPEAIRSYDGKVYLDWAFHRDERQCGTDFVIPHILTGDKHSRSLPPVQLHEEGAGHEGHGHEEQASAERRAM